MKTVDGLEEAIMAHGWVVFELTDSLDKIHHCVFTCFNDSSHWFKQINIHRDMQPVENDFLLHDGSKVPVLLENLREGNVRNLQRISLEHDLTQLREKYKEVKRIRLSYLVDLGK